MLSRNFFFPLFFYIPKPVCIASIYNNDHAIIFDDSKGLIDDDCR